MRKFLITIGLFTVVTIIVVELFFTLLILSKLFLFNYPGKEIYMALYKSNTPSSVKTLLLGDSVGYQLIPNNTSSAHFNALTSNQAISLAGQYILLKNYLHTGNKITKVVLLISPFSFQNNLNQIYTYHYFLKPFNLSPYNNAFSQTVNAQINKIPYHIFSQIPHIKATFWAPKFESKDTLTTALLSEISLEYLSKMKALTEANHIAFEIWAPPINIINKDYIESINLNTFKNYNFYPELYAYFKDINYVPSKAYLDKVHLINAKAYTAQYLLKLSL